MPRSCRREALARPPFRAFRGAIQCILRKPRNHALAHVVPAGEFSKCRALRSSPPCFGLLHLGQFWKPAHVLPALLRPAAALGGAGSSQVAFHAQAGSIYRAVSCVASGTADQISALSGLFMCHPARRGQMAQRIFPDNRV